MQKKALGFFVLVFLLLAALPGAYRQARAQAQKAPYPAMASVNRVFDTRREI